MNLIVRFMRPVALLGLFCVTACTWSETRKSESSIKKLKQITQEEAVIKSEPGPAMIHGDAHHRSVLLANGDVFLFGREMQVPQLYKHKENRIVKAKGPVTPEAKLRKDGKILINGYLVAGPYGNLHLEEALLQAHKIEYPSNAILCYLPNRCEILIAGGVISDNGTRDSTQVTKIFNLKTGIISRVGNLKNDRDSGTATLLRDGRVLIHGGETTHEGGHLIYSETEIYDSKNRTFSHGPNASDQLSGYESIVYDNGLVLLPEQTPNGLCFPIDVVDTKNNRTIRTLRPKWAEPLTNITQLLDGSVLLIFGGRKLAILNEKFELVPAGSLASRRYCAGICVLPSGKVFLSGGYDLTYGSRLPLVTTELLSVNKNNIFY